MDYMELQFPGDVQDERARSGRNINDTERWMSMAAGAGLAAYGVSQRRAAGWALAGVGAMLFRRGFTAHCDVYEMLGVNTAGTGQDTWRNLENLPRFMSHLESVERITDTLSRWRAKGPAGATVEWNAEIINEVPDQVIGWRSIEGSDVVSAGSVNFEEAGPGRGTRVRVRLQYSPPGGKVGAAFAKLMGRDPATEIREDLRRFKQIVEAGEVATNER
jgi:uncharacterized membrane protein